MAPDKERERERDRPPPRDLLKEARERREAGRRDAERAAAERKEADARQQRQAAPQDAAGRTDEPDRPAHAHRCDSSPRPLTAAITTVLARSQRRSSAPFKVRDLAEQLPVVTEIGVRLPGRGSKTFSHACDSMIGH